MNLFHNPNLQRIDFLDERFYTEDKEIFYPSVTTVLEVLPDDYGLVVWKKDLGHMADIVLKRAGEEGSQIHAACEAYTKGLPVTFYNAEGYGTGAPYNVTEWKCILKFCEFWNTVKPGLICNEIAIISHVQRLGGTVDLVLMIDGKIWMVDIKSSNYFHDSFFLQLSAYAVMWNELYPSYKIDHIAVIYLKAQTRGADKSGKKIQGAGWQLIPYEGDYNEHFKLFAHLRAIWDYANPDYKPKNISMPDRLQCDWVQPQVLDRTPVQPDMSAYAGYTDIIHNETESLILIRETGEIVKKKDDPYKYQYLRVRVREVPANSIAAMMNNDKRF